MVKFIYFGLLALVALTSAQEQELGPGECDAVGHAETIKGCASACGNDTCKLNGKPYCACEVPPTPDTSDNKYECMKLLDNMDEIMPGQPHLGQECKERCPAGQVTYVCDDVNSEDSSDNLVCVCSGPRFQTAQSNSNGAMRGLLSSAAEDLDLEGLLDLLESAIGDLCDTIFTILKTVLQTAVKVLFNALRAAVGKVKAVLSALDL